jgi:hypothetical protein
VLDGLLVALEGFSRSGSPRILELQPFVRAAFAVAVTFEPEQLLRLEA